jgi:hypothetical protein
MKQFKQRAWKILFCLATSALAGAEPPLSTVTCRVVDEAGIAISNATVLTGGSTRNQGLTDTNGLYTFKDRIYYDLAGIISKEGYYKTRGNIWSRPSGHLTDHPPKPLVVVLKKIIDPVPMNFRGISTCVPKIG